jgi:hypothetical protein
MAVVMAVIRSHQVESEVTIKMVNMNTHGGQMAVEQAEKAVSRVERDSRGRDTRIHGIVLDEGNPAPTLRELLRQWSISGATPPGDLADRTRLVLEAVGLDGTCQR